MTLKMATSAMGLLRQSCRACPATRGEQPTGIHLDWPLGGGKSSLAVAFASALSADKSLRRKARETLALDSMPDVR